MRVQSINCEHSRTIFALVIIALLVGTAAEAKYCGGTGEPNDPYRICTAEDMNAIGANPSDWNKHFILINDVNLAQYTGTQFNIIGSESIPFTGVFDGNDHKVWNFTWTSTDRDYIGLFGYVATGGQIKNLGMEDVDVNAVNGGPVGGLAATNGGTITNCYSTGGISGGGGLVGSNSGTITNCYSTGSVSGGGGGLVGGNSGTITNCYATGSVTGEVVGGLVGGNSGTITNSYSTGSVSGASCVGGLVGDNYGTITNCYSTGSVSGSPWGVGGLVGENYYGGTVTTCYATGSVTGHLYVGGLVGINFSIVEACYATGLVSGDRYVGGLVGFEQGGSITDCYSKGSVTGTGVVGGLVGYNSYYGSITGCYATGSVSGEGDVGGLVGENQDGSLTDCYTTGSVSGDCKVGGMVGWNYGYYSGTVTTCYSTGSVTGQLEVGGLVGHNGFYICDPEGAGYLEFPGWIHKCYSTGKVTGSYNVGGLVGYHEVGEVGDSFWDIETSDCNTSAGGTPKTTAEMQTESTFTDAGWDFATIWDICEGTNYPKLIWQIPIGDLVCPDGVNFIDYAFFAGHWLEDSCSGSNDCDGTDLDFSGTVDANDLKIFCENWLEGR